MRVKHTIWKVILSVVCFGLLVWMVWQADPGLLWQTLCQMPEAIGLCCLVWGVGYLLNALSFGQVLRGVAGMDDQVSDYGETWRLTVTGYALNYITPFGLLGGEPYRILALRPRMGGERSTQAVVLYSMTHVASHLLFWSIACVLVSISLPRMGGVERICLMAFLTVCLMAIVLFGYLYRRGIAPRFLRRWVKWPLLPPSPITLSRFGASLLWELLSRLVNVIEYWILMQAMGYPGFGYLDSLWVVAFSSLLANVLFFSPLQIGTREAGILLALQYLLPGDMLATALTLSFATRIREFLWIAVGLAMTLTNTLTKTKTITKKL